MNGKSGEASRHRVNPFGILQIVTVLSVTVLYEFDVFEYEQAVVALLTIVVLVLMIR